MNYRNAVTEGRRLVKRSEEDGWRLVELTGEVLAGGRAKREWARDLGVAPISVRRWGKMYERWGTLSPARRPTYSDGYSAVQMEGDDAPAEGASQRRMERDAVNRVKKMSAQEQVKLVSALLEQPDVQQELIAPGKPRPAPQRDRDPVGGGGGGQRGIIGQKQDVLAWMELSGAIGKAGVILWKALQEWNRGDLGPEAVDHLNELLDELDRRSTIFRQAINAKVDEGELDAILKGGE